MYKLGLEEVFEMESYSVVCRKCRKQITYLSDVCESDDDDSIKRGLDKLLSEHKTNLCESCVQSFGDCNGEPVFGRCKGDDNVIKCEQYSLKE